MEQVRLKYLKVTNKFDTPYVDMFDGIPVTIDPGGSQNIQAEQAAHFFGWHEGATREHMLRHTAKRRGWNTPEHLEVDDSGKPLMERLFDKLVLEPITFKLVEMPEGEGESEGEASIPAEHVPGEEEVETAPPPPKFTPTKAKPQSAKQQVRRFAPRDDE